MTPSRTGGGASGARDAWSLEDPGAAQRDGRALPAGGHGAALHRGDRLIDTDPRGERALRPLPAGEGARDGGRLRVRHAGAHRRGWGPGRYSGRHPARRGHGWTPGRPDRLSAEFRKAPVRGVKPPFNSQSSNAHRRLQGPSAGYAQPQHSSTITRVLASPQLRLPWETAKSRLNEYCGSADRDGDAPLEQPARSGVLAALRQEGDKSPRTVRKVVEESRDQEDGQPPPRGQFPPCSRFRDWPEEPGWAFYATLLVVAIAEPSPG